MRSAPIQRRLKVILVKRPSGWRCGGHPVQLGSGRLVGVRECPAVTLASDTSLRGQGGGPAGHSRHLRGSLPGGRALGGARAVRDRLASGNWLPGARSVELGAKRAATGA